LFQTRADRHVLCPAPLFAACGNHSAEAERHSGRHQKVFGFVTGMAFTFRAESRSPSHRNAVRLPTGTAFGFHRIHHYEELSQKTNSRSSRALTKSSAEKKRSPLNGASTVGALCPLCNSFCHFYLLSNFLITTSG
jgi:hypothetical protein